jgi:hypothetical protein
MEHDNRQRGEPRLEDICPRCGAPDRCYCNCTKQKIPLGKHPYKIAISRKELEIAVHHRAATGEPIQSFVRRLIRQSYLPERPESYVAPHAKPTTPKTRTSPNRVSPTQSE